MQPIYLDYNATTPIDPAVFDAMLPYLRGTAAEPLGRFGNPSSTHVQGKRAREAVEHARRQVAALLGAQPEEIIFTGGGTEATNHALKGIVLAGLLEHNGTGARFAERAAVVISSIEHPATSRVADFLGRFGCPITTLPVDGTGRVDPDQVRKALRKPAAIVSIMHANNEVGTLQPIAEISAICKNHGVPLHSDAAQSIGKVPVNVDELGVDLLTIAGHKLFAPKGVGALYARRGIQLESFIHGAGHEDGRRAGTENVPYIVGLGAACEIIRHSLPEAKVRMSYLRDRLWNKLKIVLGDRITLNGHPVERLPNTLNVSFAGCVGSELLAAVPTVAASTGSACHEGKASQSPVLSAMAIEPRLGQGAVRLSVGRFTTEEEIDTAAVALATGAERVRRD
jgi:cysteine desulfurase